MSPTSPWKVRFSYLQQQFGNPDKILNDIRRHLAGCQFTLGPEVDQFEKSFARLIGTKYAIGVGSGTDALKLSLKAAGVGPGDEVVTAANTFIATVGAINEVGARPVLVDVTRYFTINPDLIEKAITPKTKAIIPVHLTGEPADMGPILDLAGRRNLAVIEDACQAVLAAVDGKNIGTLGIAAAVSMHPQKNLNVWGDAGIIVTGSDELNHKLRLLRNHGLKNRDEIVMLGYNTRLDSIQAIVGNHMIGLASAAADKRITYAAIYDKAFAGMSDHIRLPPRRPNAKRVFHLYMVEAKKRDDLLAFLIEKGVEAKIHYPIPLHLQKGLAHLGYKKGDFPESERQTTCIITFPLDEFLTEDHIHYVIEAVREFYRTH